MVEITRPDDGNPFDFPFEQVNVDRDEFLNAIGQHKNFWVSQLEARIRSFVETNVMSWSLMSKLFLVTGLMRLIAGEPMAKDFSLAGAFISLFMRIWRLAPDIEKATLVGKWKGAVKDIDQISSFMFELAIGVYYARLGNRAIYNDLGGKDSAHDWLLNPGTNTECHVEVKATSWRTKIPLDGRTLQGVRLAIDAFKRRNEVREFVGFIKLKFRGHSQLASKKTALPQLNRLLSEASNLRSATVEEWEIEFLAKPPGYNKEFRERFDSGQNVNFENCGTVVMNEGGVGPVCGIEYVAGWDHGLAVTDNLKKALSQVDGAPLSVVWIQVSGMPSTGRSLKIDAMNLISSPESIRRFDSMMEDHKNASLAGVHIALDFEWFFHADDILALVLPNIVLASTTPAGFEKFKLYTTEIQRRDIEADAKNAVMRVRPRV